MKVLTNRLLYNFDGIW